MALCWFWAMARDMTSVYPLKKTRMHEVCGPGAQFFAVALGALQASPFLWVRANWREES